MPKPPRTAGEPGGYDFSLPTANWWTDVFDSLRRRGSTAPAPFACKKSVSSRKVREIRKVSAPFFTAALRLPLNHKEAMRRLCEGLLPLKAEIQATLSNLRRPRSQPRDQAAKGGEGDGGKAPFAFPQRLSAAFDGRKRLQQANFTALTKGKQSFHNPLCGCRSINKEATRRRCATFAVESGTSRVLVTYVVGYSHGFREEQKSACRHKGQHAQGKSQTGRRIT